jgi:microcystin-dependent protein
MPLPTLRTFATDVCETSSTLGAGTYSLDGARTGYRSFADDFNTNDTPYYVVRNAADTKYEHNRGGIFTDSGPDTLTRSVLYSSNGGAAVVWVSDDLPLNVYVPNAAEILEMLIRGWVADARDAWLKFGHWFDSSVANVVTWKIYDGANDIDLGDIDLLNSTINFRFMPAGVCVPYAGATIPPYFLACQGQSLLRADYPALFAAIGTTHGAVDGTHFTLPNIGERVVVGKATVESLVTTAVSGFSGATLGATGGAQSHTLVIGEIPAHNHTVTDPGHLHQVAISNAGVNGVGGGTLTGLGGSSSTSTDITGISINNAGGGGAHRNMQPSIVLNYIISTGGV